MLPHSAALVQARAVTHRATPQPPRVESEALAQASRPAPARGRSCMIYAIGGNVAPSRFCAPIGPEQDG